MRITKWHQKAGWEMGNGSFTSEYENEDDSMLEYFDGKTQESDGGSEGGENGKSDGQEVELTLSHQETRDAGMDSRRGLER